MLSQLTFLSRLLATTLFVLIAMALLVFAASEVLIVWYMDQNGIAIRSELSEDYGFAMLLTLVGFLVLIVGTPFVSYFGWRWIGAAFRRLGLYRAGQ
jgi:hypothetical protein